MRYPTVVAPTHDTSNANAEHAARQFVYYIPLEKFVYRRRGRWRLDEAVGREGIRNHLLEEGWHPNDIRSILSQRMYTRVYGADLAPNQPEVFVDPGTTQLFINTWTPPTLVARAGEFPRLLATIRWLCCNDDEGQRYLLNWMAAKVQDPSYIPKVAIVFATEPGAGKGTLTFAMQQMLGPENCATIQRGSLENRFNTRWIGRLFILADEVVSSNDTYKDIQSILKVLIDASEVELEGKGTNQRGVRNRAAWWFASNDKVAPVVLEAGDRRFSVFSNHDALPTSYVELLQSCFEADRVTPTTSFLEEIAALFHHLLNLPVERALLSRPYSNASREALISASLGAHELFFTEVDQNGVDDWLERVVHLSGDWTMSRARGEWDFGAEGVSSAVLYQAYLQFCKANGSRALRINKFGAALRNLRPGWKPVRLYSPTLKKAVASYVVPRKEKPTP